MKVGSLIILAWSCLLIGAPVYAAPTKTNENPLDIPLDQRLSDEPTYIRSDSLSLQSKDRIFVYSGNVNVTQGDMVLLSDSVEGRYNEQNKIEKLTAKKNVIITRGEDLKARGEQALYDATAGTLTLTENPEVEQNGSILTADKIVIYLADNRSVAEGDVRVKLVKTEETPVAGSVTSPGKHKKNQ